MRNYATGSSLCGGGVTRLIAILFVTTIAMRNWLAAVLTLAALPGCAPALNWTAPCADPPPAARTNPLLFPIANADYVWDGVTDVVGDYFRIDMEEPVRMVGNTLIEGRIVTFPKTGATLMEPWDKDSANRYERLESTLQSIRRRAVVRVIPAQDGFWIDVAVFKELENLAQPEHSTAGAATFRNDTTLTRVVNPERAAGANRGWIPLGRDPALEQRILGQLQYRLGPQGRPMPVD